MKETDGQKRRVVALVRRYSNAFDAATTLTELRAAWMNLQTAREAAKRFGYEELSEAVLAQSLTSTPEKRAIIFEALDNPLTFYTSCLDKVEQHKEYLT